MVMWVVRPFFCSSCLDFLMQLHLAGGLAGVADHSPWGVSSSKWPLMLFMAVFREDKPQCANLTRFCLHHVCWCPHGQNKLHGQAQSQCGRRVHRSWILGRVSDWQRAIIYNNCVTQSVLWLNSSQLSTCKIDLLPPKTPKESLNPGVMFEISISCNNHQVWTQMRVFIYTIWDRNRKIIMDTPSQLGEKWKACSWD